MSEKSGIRKIFIIFGLILVIFLVISLIVYFDQYALLIKHIDQIKPKIGNWVFNNQTKAEHYISKAYEKIKKILQV